MSETTQPTIKTHIPNTYHLTPEKTIYLIPNGLDSHPAGTTSIPNLYLTKDDVPDYDLRPRRPTSLLVLSSPETPTQTSSPSLLIPTIKLAPPIFPIRVTPHQQHQKQQANLPTSFAEDVASFSGKVKSFGPRLTTTATNFGSIGRSQSRGLKESYSLPVLPPLDQTPPISDSLLKLPVFAGPKKERYSPTTSPAQHVHPGGNQYASQHNGGFEKASNSNLRNEYSLGDTPTLPDRKTKKKRFTGARSMLNLSTSINNHGTIHEDNEDEDETKPILAKEGEGMMKKGGKTTTSSRMEDLRLKTGKAWSAMGTSIQNRFGRLRGGREGLMLVCFDIQSIVLSLSIILDFLDILHYVVIFLIVSISQRRS